MINTYETLAKDISQINNEVLDLIGDTKNIPKLIAPNFSKLQLICEDIASELEKNTIRVAVVGTVKSGKSTFVNSIFRKDYLKRGAGVLTSVVTRVRNSHRDQAILFLKNWEEINKEIEQSMILLSYSKKLLKDSFDIRQQKDREHLKIVLDTLKHDQTTSRTFNKSYTLLSSYLKGYKEVYKHINKENKSIIFSGKDLILHHNFVTSDHLAVYLTDVLLEIKGKTLGSDIEIADCQGSDSLNPLHLSMVQNYLNIAHIIIYVVSSRIGMKEADAKLITLIEKMGLLASTMFVVNVDLNEHNSIEDIRRLTSSTKESLLSIKQASNQIFTFSALHNLTPHSNNPKLSSKTILEFINQEYKNFLNSFNKKLNSDKHFLLINNHIHKLAIISENLEGWIEITNCILMNNTEKSEKIINDMTISCSELLNIKTTVDKSTKGSAQQIKKELFLNIDRFFGDQYRGIISKTIKFIHEWDFDSDNLSTNTSDNIIKDLYKVFQEFKQELEKYIYEVINPNIVGFIREEEVKLVKHLRSLSNLYSSMFHGIAKKYNTKTKGSKLKIGSNLSKIKVELSPIKNQIKLSPITFGSIKYRGRIKIEAAFYFYLKRGIQYLLKLINFRISREQNLYVATIKKAIEHIKNDTKISTAYYLKNHRENIKFQHIACIIKTVSEDIEQQISSQINTNAMELDKISELIHTKNLKKEKTLEALNDITKKSTKISNKIKKISLVINNIKK